MYRKCVWFMLIGVFFLLGYSQKTTSVKKEVDTKTILFQQAIFTATPSSRKVLQKAYELSFVKKVVVKGSCWDYINMIYTKAGFPAKRRKIVFKGKKRGPFAKAELIQPGDWLYFVNYSYYKVGHTGLFIGWVDLQKRLAFILSYVGQRRSIPARYKVYDISSVYYIQIAQ